MKWDEIFNKVWTEIKAGKLHAINSGIMDQTKAKIMRIYVQVAYLKDPSAVKAGRIDHHSGKILN